PYDLTARAAAQDLTNPGVLELKDVHAHVQMQDKATVELKAATGLYDTKADTMQLNTDITLTSSSGYSARLDAASVDIKTNKIVSDRPAEVTPPNGTVNANHLEVTDNGDLIRFGKGVEMNITPAAAGGPNGAAPATEPPAVSSADATPGK